MRIFLFLLIIICSNDVYTQDFAPSYKEILNQKNSKFQEKSEFYDSVSGIYSNYFYGFAFIIPQKWENDKGFAEHTIIRGLSRDSAISLAVNVIDMVENDITAWEYFDTESDFYKRSFQIGLEESLNTKIKDLEITKVYFDNYESIRSEFNYEVKHLNYSYEMK